MDYQRSDSLDALAEQLPSVLSVLLDEFLSHHEPVIRLWAACDLLEMTLKICVMSAIGEHDANLPAPFHRVLSQYIERPTLAGWFYMARAAADHLPDSSQLVVIKPTIDAVRTLLGSEKDGVEKSFIALRNALAHGGPIVRRDGAYFLAIWEKRIEAFLVSNLCWLCDAQMFAVDFSRKKILLKGSDFAHAQPMPAMPEIPENARPGSGWLYIGDQILGIGPIGLFDIKGREPLVYYRSGERVLEYIRYGPGPAVGWESDPSAFDDFRARFLLPKKAIENAPQSQRALVGEWDAIQREAARRVGREREIEILREAIKSDDSHLWISGPAGIGKSMLIVSLMAEFLADPPEQTLVVPFRFRSGSGSLGREHFLGAVWAALRLNEWIVEEKQTPALPLQEASSQSLDLSGASDTRARKKSGPGIVSRVDPVMELRNALDRVRESNTVLLILDGLDEMEEWERGFSERVLFGLAAKRVRIVAAGRPEFGLPELFSRKKARDVFPNGVPKLNESAVRGFLLERLGGLRRSVLDGDRERNGTIRNAFLEKVVQYSDGLPAYMTHLVRDLQLGRVSPANPGELPRGLQEYHRKLLQRCAIGDLQAVLSPLAVLLAVAADPLSAEECAALLKCMGRTASLDLDLVDRALGQLGSMIQRRQGRYALYHHSMRTHVLCDPGLQQTVGAIRAALALASLTPGDDHGSGYLLRRGVLHLVEFNRRQDALGLMTDFEWTMRRFRKLEGTSDVSADWYEDWKLLRSGGGFSGSAEIWWDFAKTNRHHFRHEGSESWRVFFQMAMEHASDSPVTLGAESYLASGCVDWVWLRCINRAKKWCPSPLVCVIEAKRGLELSDGRILAWGKDENLRIHDPETGDCLLVFRGHQKRIQRAIEIGGGRIISWSWDKTLRVWDQQTGDCVSLLLGHQNGISRAKELRDGRILSWSEDQTLRLWDGLSGKCVGVLSGHNQRVLGAKELRDGRILSWSEDRTLRVWDGLSGECVGVLWGNDERLVGAKELHDGRILSWGEKLRVWDAQTCSCLNAYSGNHKDVKGSTELRDGKIMSWSIDGKLFLWNREAGVCGSVFLKNEDFVEGAMELRDGGILLWGERLRVWDEKTGTERDFVGHEKGVKRAEELCHGRILSWSDDGTLRIWDRKTGDCVKLFPGHGEFFDGAEELRSGKILSWSWGGSLRVWDGKTAKAPSEYRGDETPAMGAQELKDGRILSWSLGGSLQVWDGRNGDYVSFFQEHETSVLAAKELSDGRILSWSRGHTLRVWDGQSGASAGVLRGHDARIGGAEELRDRRVISWSWDKTLRVWDVQNGECAKVLMGHSSGINGAQELLDLRVVSWSWDKTLRVWDLQTGQCLAVLRGHEKGVDGARGLRNGKILSWSWDETLRVWEAQTGNCVCELRGHEGAVVGASELGDGRILSWSLDRTVRVWNAQTGRCEGVITAHQQRVDGAKELSDGKILSWSRDGVVCVSEEQTCDCVLVLNGHKDFVEGAQELRDGRILTWGFDSTIRLWNLRFGVVLRSFSGGVIQVGENVFAINGLFYQLEGVF
jgi:WD40 repeat protein